MCQTDFYKACNLFNAKWCDQLLQDKSINLTGPEKMASEDA